MKRPFIKICCMKSVEEMQMAVAAGASAIGLVSAMPSGPGMIEEALIAEIAKVVPPPIATFLLTAEQRAGEIIKQHKFCRTNTIQFVDHIEVTELLKLREALPGIRLVQVIHVVDESSVTEACAIATLCRCNFVGLRQCETRCQRVGWHRACT